MGFDSMKIQVKILTDNNTKKLEVNKGSTVSEVLKQLQLKPDTVIVLNDDIPIPVDEKINERQEVKIIRVASGG